MKKQRTKYILVKNKPQMIVDIQKTILKNSNAGLISIELNRKVILFINKLKEIPLSAELQ